MSASSGAPGRREDSFARDGLSPAGRLAARFGSLLPALCLWGCGDGSGLGFMGWRDRTGPQVQVVSMGESDTLPGLYDLAIRVREGITPPMHVEFSADVRASLRIDTLPGDAADPAMRMFRIDLSPYSGRRTLHIDAFDGAGNLSRLSLPVQVRSRMACGDAPAGAPTRFVEDGNGDIWAVGGGLFRFDPGAAEFHRVPIPALDSGGEIDGVAEAGGGRLWLARTEASTRRISLHAYEGGSLGSSVALPQSVFFSSPKLTVGPGDAVFGLWHGKGPKSGIFMLSDTGLALFPPEPEPVSDYAVDRSGRLWLLSGMRLIAYDPPELRIVDSLTPPEGLSAWPLSLDASGRIVLNSGTHRLIRADTGWLEVPFPPGEVACFDQPGGEGMWCFPGTVPSHVTYYRGGAAPIRYPLETSVPRFLVDARGRLWTTRGNSGYCGLSPERF